MICISCKESYRPAIGLLLGLCHDCNSMLPFDFRKRLICRKYYPSTYKKFNSTHASQVHARTRISTYTPTTPPRSIVAVKMVNFVQKPKPVFVVWRGAKRKSLDMMETINGNTYHQINIGAGMLHWIAA